MPFYNIGNWVNDEAKKFYNLDQQVTHVNVASFKGLQTENVETTTD